MHHYVLQVPPEVFKRLLPMRVESVQTNIVNLRGN
ncbi:unnamed protein product [Paramecium octaurelia]|uniref:Uncharacterized protein n=1 Tax=Paramecium octaurelia TaxID=43137 RepID=A0A8S1XGT6_PAROT|nr:unnamed protein product [Paramecium octaurelia]